MSDVKQQIEAAVRKIAPDGEDWRTQVAVSLLSRRLSMIPFFTSRLVRPTATAAQARRELESLAKTFEAFRGSIDDLSFTALVELECAYGRKGDVWPTILIAGFLNRYFPDLPSAARAAAANVTEGDDTRCDTTRHDLADVCAGVYKLVTGRAPARSVKTYGDDSGREAGGFHLFAADIFGIAGLKRSDRIARAAITRRRLSMKAVMNDMAYHMAMMGIAKDEIDRRLAGMDIS